MFGKPKLVSKHSPQPSEGPALRKLREIHATCIHAKRRIAEAEAAVRVAREPSIKASELDRQAQALRAQADEVRKNWSGEVGTEALHRSAEVRARQAERVAEDAWIEAEKHVAAVQQALAAELKAREDFEQADKSKNSAIAMVVMEEEKHYCDELERVAVRVNFLIKRAHGLYAIVGHGRLGHSQLYARKEFQSDEATELLDDLLLRSRIDKHCQLRPEQNNAYVNHAFDAFYKVEELGEDVETRDDLAADRDRILARLKQLQREFTDAS
jgi:hypothetical protein